MGQTKDIKDRLERHNQGRSLSTKRKRPWVLVHLQEYQTRIDAVQAEKYIKVQHSKKYIESLVTYSKV